MLARGAQSRQELQGLVQGGITAVGQIFFREDWCLNVGRDAASIEGFTILCQVDFIGKAKRPSVGQFAIENVGENALRVGADSDDVRLAVE